MNLIAPMGYVTKAIGNPSKNVAYMMMEGILLTIVQIGAGCVGACVCERGSFGRLMKKAGFITGIACVSALGCIVTQTLCFWISLQSSPWAGTLMTDFSHHASGVTVHAGITPEPGYRRKLLRRRAQETRHLSGFTVLLARTCSISGYLLSPWPCKFLTWFMPQYPLYCAVPGTWPWWSAAF
ncbi:MAG: hypothetical protein ACLTW9_12680 [Enterocloster sp.]